MPELPEVETVRMSLAPAVVGRRVERVEILDERLTRPAPAGAVAASLRGDVVTALERRGKYLVFRLQSGRCLLVHLRMTGGFQEAADPYCRARIEFDDGSELRYRDVRRFGTWLLLDGAEAADYLRERLGPEPLSPVFTPAALARGLEGRRRPVKAALLDQATVAGLGNIYADEALWRARIFPVREAGTLSRREIETLRDAVVEVLREAIARGGSTLPDGNYRDPRGTPGAMQDEFRVYGLEHEPCPRCGTPIAKTRVAGRGTWFCPACQREGDR